VVGCHECADEPSGSGATELVIIYFQSLVFFICNTQMCDSRSYLLSSIKDFVTSNSYSNL
jgi:hypothetical protein